MPIEINGKVIEFNKIPKEGIKHKYSIRDQGKYTDLMEKKDEEWTEEEKAFVLDMEKATYEYMMEAYDYPEEVVKGYVKTMRKQTRETMGW